MKRSKRERYGEGRKQGSEENTKARGRDRKQEDER